MIFLSASVLGKRLYDLLECKCIGLAVWVGVLRADNMLHSYQCHPISSTSHISLISTTTQTFFKSSKILEDLHIYQRKSVHVCNVVRLSKTDDETG